MFHVTVCPFFHSNGFLFCGWVSSLFFCEQRRTTTAGDLITWNGNDNIIFMIRKSMAIQSNWPLIESSSLLSYFNSAITINNSHSHTISVAMLMMARERSCAQKSNFPLKRIESVVYSLYIEEREWGTEDLKGTRDRWPIKGQTNKLSR